MTILWSTQLSTFTIVEHLPGGFLLMVVYVLLCERKDLGQDGRLDVAHLRGAILRSQQLVDATKTSP